MLTATAMAKAKATAATTTTTTTTHSVNSVSYETNIKTPNTGSVFKTTTAAATMAATIA